MMMEHMYAGRNNGELHIDLKDEDGKSHWESLQTSKPVPAPHSNKATANLFPKFLPNEDQVFRNMSL